MNYQTFSPSEDLAPLVNFYWTLEVPQEESQIKQRIIPDGNIEMAFILGDDVKRFTSESEYILQPRSMVIGQIINPFVIQPTGYVNTFSVSFFPHGFANFVKQPINNLKDKETPLSLLFGEDDADNLEKMISDAKSTKERIAIVESFLYSKLANELVIDKIVQSTLEVLFAAKGNIAIGQLVDNKPSQRRQLERKFLSKIGINPKQLGKILRMQSALKLLLESDANSLTSVAHKCAYYDQSHFIKDFKEFTGVSPGEFLGAKHLELSSLFYK